MKLISTGAAAEMLGVSPATLRGWRCSKTGPPFVRLSARNVMYDENDIERYIAERRFVPSVRDSEINKHFGLQAEASGTSGGRRLQSRGWLSPKVTECRPGV